VACVPLPEIPLPPDIFPLSLEPHELPPADVNLDECCKLLDFTVKIPIPLPPVVLTSAVLATVREQVKIAQAWLDALPLDCPLE